jgi:hypothetical protein
MKHFFAVLVLVFFIPFLSLGQSVFKNSINGVNPNELNPYTIGQLVDLNITASGIGRGNGILGINANNRYNARSWNSSALDSNAYFEFTLSPNADREIDFISFVYTGRTSANGPIHFAFRSSIDGFVSDIGLVTATGSTVSLESAVFQNVTSPITFRLYGWAANTGTGTFSINDFQFNGVTSCAIPQAPVLSDASLSCSSTSFELNWQNGLYASNYYLNVATDSGFANSLTGYQDKELGNVLSESILNLSVGGTYHVRLRSANSCGTSDYSNLITVTSPETVYNGVWSNGIPDASKKARFSSDFNLDTNLEACSCQIDSGVEVHVNTGVVLKLENELDVVGTGTLVFENNSSLVQVNDNAVNRGAIIYKRNAQPMNNFDYTYWSSPVLGQTLKALSPNTIIDKYFSFANNNWVYEDFSATMSPPGKGHIIRVPKPGTYGMPYPETVSMPYAQPVQFVGTPNNGNYSLPIEPAGNYNLIGNPYPSAMSADEFLKENAIDNTRLEGTIYFWTHNTELSNTGYNASDYALYNTLGGIAAGNIGGKPLGSIAAGQSFFIQSKDGTEAVIFKNSMRIANVGSNQQFFKGTKPKTIPVTKHRFWLNMTNTKGIFKQLLVGYATGATNRFDAVFDGVSLNSNKDIDFYSVNDSLKLVIQGRALPFDKTDKVPLGFMTTTEGTFEIAINETDGIFVNQKIYLEDKKTRVLHDLKKGSYVFTTAQGEFNDRFVLRFMPIQKFAPLQEVIENGAKQLQIIVQDNQLNISSAIGNLSAVFIYDLKGRLVYQKNQINKQQIIISDLIPKHQVLIVKTVFSNAVNRTDKIVF